MGCRYRHLDGRMKRVLVSPMNGTAQSTGFAKTYESERVGPRWLRQTLIPLLLTRSARRRARRLVHAHRARRLALLARRIFPPTRLRFGFTQIWGPVFFGTKTGVDDHRILRRRRARPHAPSRGARFVDPSPRTATCPSTRPTAVLAFAVTLGLFAGASFGLHLFAAVDRLRQLRRHPRRRSTSSASSSASALLERALPLRRATTARAATRSSITTGAPSSIRASSAGT